jgi:chemotaxis family two-component system response regulator Rcp1
MSIVENGRRIEILLVEDSPGDVRLTREALKGAKVLIKLHVASDGAEAMTLLGRERKHANVPRPDLILLDLNLPKKDGRAVLAGNPSLQTIPVVTLSTSESVLLTKPVNLDGFLRVVKSIDNVWLSVVKLPRVVSS